MGVHYISSINVWSGLHLAVKLLRTWHMQNRWYVHGYINSSSELITASIPHLAMIKQSYPFSPPYNILPKPFKKIPPNIVAFFLSQSKRKRKYSLICIHSHCNKQLPIILTLKMCLIYTSNKATMHKVFN